MNEKWAHGRRYLLKWDTNGVITTSAGARKSRITGEAVLVICGGHEETRGIYLDRFGLVAASVKAAKAETGVISVIGESATGAVKMGRQTDSIRIDAACKINYESLDRAHGKAIDKGCYYIPATESAAVLIEGKAAASKDKTILGSVRIHVTCAAEEFQEVIRIEVQLKKANLIPIDGPPVHYRFDREGNWKPSSDSNTDDNVCVSAFRRQLIVQPVGFRNAPGDVSPSASTAAAQFATAQTVWEKACIDLVIRATVFINNATLKVSSDVAAIRAAFTDADPNAIEVFFVQNGLAAQGGGTAGGIGVASCKPVIAEPNGGNPVLVAHELGHVLGLLHPPSANSDPGTVMAPTGSPMVPGTQLVTHIMCTSIANPAIQTTVTACCFSHDIPNHYLRDFPTDTGNEPSEPIAPGMNRYAMSNVWNRRSNTPGVASATTGPDHQNPARFNSDLTPRTNFLFAKVEQLLNLPVRNAEVRFFLKHPGSGGGAANLQLLGSVPVPVGLGIGTPQTITLPWVVPAGTPNHSCVFAVVTSAAEPAGDQSSLDWWQFETLSYNDNDWAQRNLDIENVSSSNSDDSNVYQSAPFFIYLPPKDQRPATSLVLEIDATQAKGLRDLSLEIFGGEKYKIGPGARQKLELDIRKVRERFVGAFSATIPGGLKIGTTFTVAANPSIGNRSFIGWATQFRVTGKREVFAQTIDSAAAGLGDLAELVELPSVHALFCLATRSSCNGRYSGKQLIELLLGKRAEIESSIAELAGLEAGAETSSDQAARRLLEALEQYEAGKLNEDSVVAAYRDLGNRAMMSAALLSSADSSGVRE